MAIEESVAVDSSPETPKPQNTRHVDFKINIVFKFVRLNTSDKSMDFKPACQAIIIAECGDHTTYAGRAVLAWLGY